MVESNKLLSIKQFKTITPFFLKKGRFKSAFKGHEFLFHGLTPCSCLYLALLTSIIFSINLKSLLFILVFLLIVELSLSNLNQFGATTSVYS